MSDWQTALGGGGGSPSRDLFAGATSGVFANQVAKAPAPVSGYALQRQDPASLVGKSDLNLADPVKSMDTIAQQQSTLIGGVLGGLLPQGPAQDIGRWLGDNVLSFPTNVASNVLRAIPNPVDTGIMWMATPDSDLKRNAARQIAENPLDALDLMASFARKFWQQEVEAGRINPLYRNFGPATSLGDGVDRLLSSLGFFADAAQRTAAGGVLGGGRDKEFAAMVARGEKVPDHIKPMWDKFQSGEWNRDRFLDELTVSGAGYSDNQFENLLLSMSLDPLLIASFAGGGIGAVAKGARLSEAVEFTGKLADTEYEALKAIVKANNIGGSINEAVLKAAEMTGGYESQIAAASKVVGRGGKAAVALYENPVLAPIFKTVQTINDPLRYFGKDHAARFAEGFKSQAMTEGATHAYGATNVEQSIRLIVDAGMDPEPLQKGFGIGVANMGRVWQARQIGRDIMRTQRVLKMAPNEAVEARLKAFGSNISRHMEDFVDTVRPRYFGTGGGTASKVAAAAEGRAGAAQRLAKMYGRAPEDFTAVVANMNPQQLGFVDMAYFGHTIDTFTTAKAAMQRAGIALPEMDRLTVIGPKNLTQKRAQVILDAMKKGDEASMQSVRAAVHAYEDLAFNFAESNMTDAELIKAVKGYIEGAWDDLSTTIDARGADLRALVGEDMARWVEDNGGIGYELGMGPNENNLYRLVRDPETGDIVGVNPWVDWVNEESAKYRPGSFTRIKDTLFREVRGERIQREARDRFVRILTGWEHVTISAADADAIFHAVGKIANDMNLMPRGLSGTRMWEGVRAVTLPIETMQSIGPRDIAAAITRAYEGNFATVGATQKATGILKTETSSLGNVVGQVAEHYYPLARFTANAWFQAQEFVEPFILAAMRGIKPGVKLSELDHETLRIVDNLLKNGRHMKFDQAEYSDVLLWGAHESKRVIGPTTRGGRAAEAMIPAKVRGKGGWSVAEAKQVAYAGQIRKTMGDEFYLAMQQLNPAFYAELQRHYGTIDRGLIAIKYLNEKAAAGAAGGSYSEVLARMSKPADFGARAHIDEAFIRRVMDVPTLDALRTGLRDGTITRDALSDVLKTYGANDDFVARAWQYITGPTPEEFSAAHRLQYGLSAAAEREYMMLEQGLADAHGVSLHEHIATTYAKVPQAIGTSGRVPAGYMLQTAKEVFKRKNITLLETTHPRVIATRDAMDKYLASGEAKLAPKSATTVPGPVGAYNRLRSEGAESLAPAHPSYAMTDAKGGLVATTGRVSPGHWLEQVHTVLGETKAGEAGLWYHEMGTSFLGLTDQMEEPALRIILGSQYDTMAAAGADLSSEAAAKLLVSWGASQMNTSPSNGWKFLLRLMDEIGFGARPGARAGRFGLNEANLERVMRRGERLTERGLGEKLFDFIDSIRMSPTRSIKAHLGDTRMPAAGDIWAARDVGFVDETTLGRVAAREGISMDEAAAKVGVLSRDDPRVLTLNPETGKMVRDGKKYKAVLKETGLQPTFVSVSDNMYEYIVQFYNDAAKHLNAESYLTRTDWTAADAQAMGWVRAQKAFGVDADNPDLIFGMNSRQVFSPAPPRGGRYSQSFPDGELLSMEQKTAIADDWNKFLIPKVEELTGVTIMHNYAGFSTALAHDGSIAYTPGVSLEVMGTDAAVQDAVETIALMGQHENVVATRGVKAQNAVARLNQKWAIDIVPEGVLEDADLAEFHRMVAEYRPEFAPTAVPVTYDDGRKGIRVVFSDDLNRSTLTKAHFEAVWPDGMFDELGQRGQEQFGKMLFHRRVVSSVETKGNFVGSDSGQYIAQSLRSRGRTTLADGLEREHGFDAFAAREDIYLKHAEGAYVEHRAFADAGDPNTLYQSADDLGPQYASTGRVVAPEEMAALKTRGQELMDVPTPSRPIDLQANIDAVADTLHQRTALVEWGGATYSPRTGQFIEDANPWMHHGTSAGNETAIAERGLSGTFTTDVRDRAIPKGEQMVMYRTRSFRGKWSPDKFPEWQRSRGNIAPENLQVSRDGGQTWEDAVKGSGAGDGPWVSGVGKTTSISIKDAQDPLMFRAALGRFANENAADLQRPGYYIGTFRDEKLGTVEFDVARATFTEADTEAVQAFLGREGGAYNMATGNGLFAPRTESQFQYATPGRIRGAVSFEADGRAILHASKLSNRTTALHELAHVMERDLDPSMRASVIADFNLAKGSATTIWTREHSEWFADGFNQYLATRVAPTPKLKNAFDYFAKWLKRALGITRRQPGGISDEMAAVYDQLLTPMKVEKALPHELEQETYFQAAMFSLQRGEDEAYKTQYFKRGRSWLERSVNHPYLGYYPASYYWGKILPEMTKFLMATPFGIPAPLGGLMAARHVWESVVTQKETDPGFRDFMDGNEGAFRTLGMLIPATPWDIPVNAALPYRRLAQADLENRKRVSEGKDPLPVNFGKIAGDAASYINPVTSMVGVGSKLLGYADDSTSMLAGSLEDAATQLTDVFTGETGSKYGFVPQQ